MSDFVLGKQRLQHFHFAALVRDRDEEFRALEDFIRDGLAAGEKAIHINDANLRDDHCERLAKMGVPVKECLRVGQLELLGWEDAHLKNGLFDCESMLALLDEAVRTSKAEGFPRLRLIGHMGWVRRQDPGNDKLLEYESRADHLIRNLGQPAVCVYDLHQFSGSTIIDVMRTHPYVFLDGALMQSPLYRPLMAVAA